MIKPTTSLYVVSIGTNKPDKFDQFALDWWKAVSELDPMPDQIVICATEGNTCKILDVPSFAIEITNIVFVNNNSTMADHLNCAVKATTGMWNSWIGIDDQVAPNLFSEVNTATDLHADLIITGMTTFSGKVVYGNWNKLMRSRNNSVLRNTICRKVLWEKVGGYPNLYFNDWGFWIKCWGKKPKIYKSKKVHMIFNDSETHNRLSGLANQDKFPIAYEQIESLKRDLGYKRNFRDNFLNFYFESRVVQKLNRILKSIKS